MSEKFSSGTINPKQTNKQTSFSPNEFISIVHNNVLTKLDLIVAKISMYDISGTHLDNNTSNHAEISVRNSGHGFLYANYNNFLHCKIARDKNTH